MSGTLIRILLVLLPIVLYLLWLRYSRRKRAALEAGDEAALAAAQSQLAWAVGFLVVVTTAAFAYLAFSSGADPERQYVPPRVEDGRVVPGEFRAPDAVEDQR